MKKIKILFIIIAIILLLPICAFAEGSEEAQSSDSETEVKEDNRVKIYFFRGDGCPHCEEAEEWFNSIQADYGQYYTLVDYEVWKNEDNADLMEKVADARDEKAEGVPYIIIGNKSWNGFSEDYTEEMLSEIKSEYDKDVEDRYDIMKLLDSTSSEKKENNNLVADILITFSLIIICVGIGAFAVYARKNVS